MTDLRGIRLVILDIDGVICCNDAAVPGASESIETLRSHGLLVRFLTNDAISSRASRSKELNDLGFNVSPSEIYTATSLTATYLRQIGSPKTMLLVESESREEFYDIPIVDQSPDIVVIGDCFSSYTFSKLNQAFISILKGARFLAVQRNRYWSSSSVPIIDIGFWVSGLEYCTGVQAEVIGKPSINSYLTICQDIGINPDQSVMVSDDSLSDLIGAREAGLITVHATDCSVKIPVLPTTVPDLVVSNLSEFAKVLCD